jgi:hypothetical protein
MDSTTNPELFQLQDTRPLYGMANYHRWRHPRAEKISPSDIDAWQHSRTGDRHLFIDFKAAREGISKMGGQLEGLRSLSRRPGVQVLIVFDPFNEDCSDERMDPATPLRVKIIRNGEVRDGHGLTVGKFAQAVWDWQWGNGPLAEKIPDYTAIADDLQARGVDTANVIDDLLSRGADGAAIVAALRPLHLAP